MASTNGILSPQSQLNIVGNSPQLSAKRKRSESIEPRELANGTKDSKEGIQSQSMLHDSQQQIDDFVEVLKRYMKRIQSTPCE
jgi:hypothetical protein